MSIYVDELKYHETPLKWKQWCHMLSDGDVEELHEMAKKIGLKRSWFQPKSFPHYDLVPSKRILALKYGAISTSTLKYMRIILKKRKN